LHESRGDRLKLFTTAMLLRARRQEWDIFTHGDYNPVDVQGSRRDHVFAFARTAGDRRVIVVRTAARRDDGVAWRRAAARERVWGDTRLVPLPGVRSGGFHNVMTDCCVPLEETGAIRVADVFDRFPVAVLVGG
jgi:(1->4)-alpha-D-glucan 1-alpha-D-glucosylmutase